MNYPRRSHADEVGTYFSAAFEDAIDIRKIKDALRKSHVTPIETASGNACVVASKDLKNVGGWSHPMTDARLSPF